MCGGGQEQKSGNHIWVLRVGPQGSQQNTWDQVPPSPLGLQEKRGAGKIGWMRCFLKAPGDVHGCRGRQKPNQLEAKPGGPSMGGRNQQNTLGTGCQGSGKGVDRGLTLHPPLFQPG